MPVYDIIGDVHGCASMLVGRLVDMGYERRGGVGAFTHRERTAVFVGDLVDRGPQQLETLELVKAMVDAGSALIVMGNHEFNAIAFATEHPKNSGEYLRRHNNKNVNQHRAFLDQLTESQRKYYAGWFKTLPLWLELDGGARVVHACWHQKSIEDLKQVCDGGNRFTESEHWVLANDGKSVLYRAVENVLKGPELDLAGYGLGEFRDRGGHPRGHARIRWWRRNATTLAELAEINGTKDIDGNPYPPLDNIKLHDKDRAYVYTDEVLVFYGHYWREDWPEERNDYTDHTACVDFSAVDHGLGGGKLVAYRWHGENKINPEHYRPRGTEHRDLG